MKYSLLSLLLLSIVSTFGYSNPVGDEAFYRIVKDRSRTSGMIESGELLGSVVTQNEQGNYDVKLDYKFMVTWMGRQQGSKVVEVEAEYFEPEFIVNLRETGHYENDEMKIDHKGYETITNQDGTTYRNTDVLHFYDLDVNKKSFLVVLAKNMVKKSAIAKAVLEKKDIDLKGEVENLELYVRRAEGIPVLGAVRIDVSGDYSGMHIKAGGDYTPSH